MRVKELKMKFIEEFDYAPKYRQALESKTVSF